MVGPCVEEYLGQKKDLQLGQLLANILGIGPMWHLEYMFGGTDGFLGGEELVLPDGRYVRFSGSDFGGLLSLGLGTSVGSVLIIQSVNHMDVFVENMGTIKVQDVVLLSFTSLDLVDITKCSDLLGVLVGTDDVPCGELLSATLGAVYRRKLGGDEGVGTVLLVGYIQGDRDYILQGTGMGQVYPLYM